MSSMPLAYIYIITFTAIFAFAVWWNIKKQQGETRNRKERDAVLKMYIIRRLRVSEIADKSELITYLKNSLPEEKDKLTLDEVERLLDTLLHEGAVVAIKKKVNQSSKTSITWYKANPSHG